MAQNIVYLHGQPEPVAHYLRLGTLHRQIETLLGSGRMPLDRVFRRKRLEQAADSRRRRKRKACAHSRPRSPSQRQTSSGADGGSRSPQAFELQRSGLLPRGLDDTLKNPKAHYLRQRTKQFERISRIPEARRAQDFLDKDLADAARTARQAEKLKVSDEGLAEMLRRTSERLDRMVPLLDDLNQTVGTTSRSPSPRRRLGRAGVSASKGR